MRAPHPRASLCAAVLLAAPLACTKNNRNTNVSIADGEGVAAESARVDPGKASQPARPANIEKIAFSGSVVGVGDMLDAGSKLNSMWSPPEPGAPPPDFRNLLEVLLVQEGFGPGFLASIDLDDVHAAEFEFPHEGQPGTTGADIELRVAMTAINPVRAIESFPADLQPQAIGQDIWQLAEDDAQLLFRAHGDALKIATSMPDLDVASGLRAKVPVGPDEPRIRLSATNLPPGEIDVSELIPLLDQVARPLSSILNETTAIDIAVDFGTDRDLVGRIGAVAPFDRLRLDSIGPATQAPSELAKAMPGNAIAVWLMPWGDPATAHRVLDKQIPVDQIPAPFDGYVDEVLKGAHAVLGQIRDEVLAASYVDAKGHMTIAFAAEVGDHKAAQAAMREIWVAAEKAFNDHIALVGKSPDHLYSVTFKQGAVKAGKAKADLFTLTVPKDKQKDLKGASWFVGSKKPKLEISTLAVDGKIIVAIGAGQKAFMAEVGRTLGKGDGLEAGGLELARKVTDGCQYCVAIDPEELAEMIFTVHATNPDEPEEVHKVAKDALSKIAKLDLDGQIALALRLEKDRGVLGLGIPKTLLFTDPAKVRMLVELMDALEDARKAAWQTGVAAGIPGGAGWRAHSYRRR